MGDLEKYSLWEQQYVEGLSGSGHELWVRACAVGPGMRCGPGHARGSRHALWVPACAVGPGMRCGSRHALWVRACGVGPGMRCGSRHALWVRACAGGGRQILHSHPFPVLWRSWGEGTWRRGASHVMWERKDGAGLTPWSFPPPRVGSGRAAFSVLGRQGSGEWEAQKRRPCHIRPRLEKSGSETWRYFCPECSWVGSTGESARWTPQLWKPSGAGRSCPQVSSGQRPSKRRRPWPAALCNTPPSQDS